MPKIYQVIASAFVARENCLKSGNKEWEVRHADNVNAMVRYHLPSGSGFDAGTNFDWYKSRPDCLVFRTSYHHMNEAGYYCGWTEHVIRVRPAFDGIKIDISGENRNGIKDLIHDTFSNSLDVTGTGGNHA